MNVLVYSGPEVLPQSLARTVSLLTSLLRPNYVVQTVAPQSLITHPWTVSCALLVFPACNHLAFPSPLLRKSVKDYVEGGGSLLALAAKINRIPSIPSDNTLYFRDASSANSYSLTSIKATGPLELGPVSLGSGSAIIKQLPYYPSSVLDNDFRSASSSTLGVFDSTSNDLSGKPAVATFVASRGKIGLWAHSMEALDENDTSAGAIADEGRTLATPTLADLGIAISSDVRQATVPKSPLPQFLVGNPVRTGVVEHVISALESVVTPEASQSSAKILKDANDTFYFQLYNSETVTDLLEKGRSGDASGDDTRHVIVCTNTLPSRAETPIFDTNVFFEALNGARTVASASPSSSSPWGVGDALVYGEAVTSTQTLLEKNPTLLSALPTPLLSIASHQLTGRGRGANTWLSPAGCLQFSLLLRVPLTALPGSKLVFVQYLFALAVAEACTTPEILGPRGAAVRIKWPNDIYAVTAAGERKKIGGILVNTSFSGGQVDVVIGCGINILNEPPITSLAQLVPPEDASRLSMERSAAAIMATFEPMWAEFVNGRGSFEPFMDRYLEKWLHSDQLVTLTTTTPHTAVRIVGITPDHGLLRTIPEPASWSGGTGQPQFIDLQPDGNSFDLMAGLIKSKS